MNVKSLISSFEPQIQSNIQKLESLPKLRIGYFNCWCATLYILGEITDLYWVDNQEMDDWLYENTEDINENDIRIGDILVMYNQDDVLMHTAIYIGEFDNKRYYYHKPGGYVLEFATYDEICGWYSYCEGQVDNEYYAGSYTFKRRK